MIFPIGLLSGTQETSSNLSQSGCVSRFGLLYTVAQIVHCTKIPESGGLKSCPLSLGTMYLAQGYFCLENEVWFFFFVLGKAAIHLLKLCTDLKGRSGKWYFS